ncbi:Uncharacterised protein [Kurthia zopfii]|uniref:Uncharacterized protein DUF4288 n=2 Tax=Kurthia zopfii TaxID=1650 RepID=A0A8B4Q4X6_9BACL|nr:uncharacterized protein DUF4288 [Kurthia zopfii]STX08857.1 Uncharacterised protein [Kurthia zopfii]
MCGDLMKNFYSVKLLFESVVSLNLSPEKIFEERIILVQAENSDDISNLVYSKFPPDTYSNSEGGFTTIQLVEILDVFELVDDIEESLNFKEVYSRHLIFEQDVTAKEAIGLYSLDK